MLTDFDSFRSMPPQANWEYDYKTEMDFENETAALLKKDVDWVNIH